MRVMEEKMVTRMGLLTGSCHNTRFNSPQYEQAFYEDVGYYSPSRPMKPSPARTSSSPLEGVPVSAKGSLRG